jgi:hypothetical protein
LDEAKKDGGPRNSVLYGFLLNKVAPIVAKTIVENGFTAEVHDNTKDKVKDIKVDVKKGGIGGITRIFVNYYNGETYIAISNHKFLNGNEKTALAFVSPLDNCVYIVPSPVLQSNWRNIMHSDRSIVSVSDALGMRNEISICDVAKVCELAEDEGYVYNMSADSAAKFHTELTKYEEVDTNERKRNMTESEMTKYPGFDALCEGDAQPNTESSNKAEDPFAVEPIPGEAGKYLAKRILQNTLYAIQDPKKRRSCLNNYKKVFLSGEISEFKSFVMEIQARIKEANNNW